MVEHQTVNLAVTGSIPVPRKSWPEIGSLLNAASVNPKKPDEDRCPLDRPEVMDSAWVACNLHGESDFRQHKAPPCSTWIPLASFQRGNIVKPSPIQLGFLQVPSLSRAE